MSLFDLIYQLSSLFLLILGVFVIFDAFKKTNNRIFSAWAFSASAWMQALFWGFWFSMHAYWDATLITFRLAFSTGVLMLTLMTVFFYYFPKVTVKVHPALRYLYIGFTIFLTLASFLTPLIHKSIIVENGVYTGDVLGAGYSLYTFDIILNFFASLYLAFKKYRNTQGIERKKIALSTFGYFIFIFFAVLFNVILPFFGIINLFMQQLVPILSIVFLLPTFYALRKYRFFNFSNASLNVLRQLIMYCLYVFAVTFTYYSLGFSLEPGVLKGTISAIIGLVVFKIAENKIPHLVTSSFRHLKNTLTKFKSKVFYCENYQELQELIERFFLIDLNFVNVRVLVIRKGHEKFNFPIYHENHFTQFLVKHGKEALIKEEIFFKRIDEKVRKILLAEMEKLEADLCLPLFSDNNLIGLFILKQKNSEEHYSKEILKEIFSAKKDLEIGLMNILLKMNLQEENNLMKSIIDKKTKQLKKKIEEINMLVQQQSDFIAVTAHEFRTPLAIASFQIEDILQSRIEEGGKKQIEDLRVVESSLNDLKQLTEKLFAVQQYDLNKVSLNREKVDLKNFMEKIYTDFEPIMKEKKLEFNFQSNIKKNIFVNMDQIQIRQVMHNLLRNAYKFTPERGSILLKLFATQDHAIISVDDNGPGIPEGLKKIIFEKFSTKSTEGGIGLGLYLCKKIVGLHKGKLWVEDTEKGGASFRIQLNALKE